MSTYRPQYRERGRFRSPTPPPPLPRKHYEASQQPRPAQYTFGGDSYRPGERDDFTFRSGPQNSFPSGASGDETASRKSRGARAPRASQRERRGGGFRDFRQPVVTSDRPLLRSKRGNTPEQLEGMGNGIARFGDVAAIFDAEGAEDDLSEDAEPSHKKTRLNGAARDESVPKWSNPDPYFLPPLDDQGNKKDVVQLIRKAKAAAATSEPPKDSLAENFNFISFGSQEVVESTVMRGGVAENADFVSFGDDDDVTSVDTMPPVDAPTGPRAQNGTDYGNTKREEIVMENIMSIGSQRLGRKRKRDIVDGDIVYPWLVDDPSHPRATPWCTADHSRTERVGDWFHKEICDFYAYVRPQRIEDMVREDLVKRIAGSLARKWPNGRLHCFGSFPAGLYLPTADMDLVFISDDYERSGVPLFGRAFGPMKKMMMWLEDEGIAEPHSNSIVAKAKVPIIKFTDNQTGIKVDISFENTTGLVANETFRQWKQQYPAMPAIVSLLKQFLAMRELNEVYTGGLGGFSLICLVVSLLQTMPQSQTRNFDAQHNLGDVFMEFLDFYGNKFNMSHNRISLNPPAYIPKGQWELDGRKPTKFDRLSIIDPNNPINDISGGSSKIELIFKCFARAYKDLESCMGRLRKSDHAIRQGQSILGAVFAGDYSIYDNQRARLRQIHNHHQYR